MSNVCSIDADLRIVDSFYIVKQFFGSVNQFFVHPLLLRFCCSTFSVLPFASNLLVFFLSLLRSVYTP